MPKNILPSGPLWYRPQLFISWCIIRWSSSLWCIYVFVLLRDKVMQLSALCCIICCVAAEPQHCECRLMSCNFLINSWSHLSQFLVNLFSHALFCALRPAKSFCFFLFFLLFCHLTESSFGQRRKEVFSQCWHRTWDIATLWNLILFPPF